jgi:ankyrin repeat protein
MSAVFGLKSTTDGEQQEAVAMEDVATGNSSNGNNGNAADAASDLLAAVYDAASEGNIGLVKTYLSANGNSLIVDGDQNGYTLLHAAAAYCRLDLMNYLMTECNADVNVVDKDGDTPLHHCEKVEAARALVETYGADASKVNAEAKTAADVKLEDIVTDEDEEYDSEDEENNSLIELADYLKGIN